MRHHFVRFLACVWCGGLFSGPFGCVASARPPIADVPLASTRHADPSLSPAGWNENVHAHCCPPIGWTQQLLKTTDKSKHLLWISPSGSTAYGVLTVTHLLMPLASDERILGEFVKGVRDAEGSAELEAQTKNPSMANGIGGIAFISKGGTYTVRGNLVSSGRNAWIWYAGTLTARPVEAEELTIAERARDATVIAPAREREENDK